MMQVDINEGYICPVCKCRIHSELEKEFDILLCPYCDSTLDLLKLEPKLTSTSTNEKEDS